jgi:hypothetical protein
MLEPRTLGSKWSGFDGRREANENAIRVFPFDFESRFEPLILGA